MAKKQVKKTTKKPVKKTVKKEDSVVEYVNKTYGKDRIFKLPKKADEYDPKNFISSGSLCLNYIITGDYRCGFPRKRPIEIFGNESVGKSTLALHVAKEAYRNKQMTLFCDVENGLNEFYAKKLGIGNEFFYYFISDFGEESFEMSDDLLKRFKFDLFIYDSIGGMRTRSVIEGGYDDKNIGDHAKLTGNAAIKLGKIFRKKNIAAIFINQLGVGNISGFGNPNDTKGGKTLKFQLWTRLEVVAPRSEKVEQKQKGSLDDIIETKEEEKPKTKKDKKKKKPALDTVETGTIITVKSIKNKLFLPRRICRMKVNYGRGFDKAFDLIEYLDMQKLAKRNGPSKIIYPVSSENSMMNTTFINKIKEDKEFKKEIKDAIEKHRKSIQIVTEDENFLD